MTDEQPISLSPTGPTETVLNADPAGADAALEVALGQPLERRNAAVAAVVANWPRSLDAWATLGSITTDPIESYAYFRVAYHRGLDRLRESGWRGSGYVRFEHPTNRGFLKAVDGLRRAAALIKEFDEEDRCNEFLYQLDPEWNRKDAP